MIPGLIVDQIPAGRLPDGLLVDASAGELTEVEQLVVAVHQRTQGKVALENLPFDRLVSGDFAPHSVRTMAKNSARHLIRLSLWDTLRPAYRAGKKFGNEWRRTQEKYSNSRVFQEFFEPVFSTTQHGETQICRDKLGPLQKMAVGVGALSMLACTVAGLAKFTYHYAGIDDVVKYSNSKPQYSADMFSGGASGVLPKQP